MGIDQKSLPPKYRAQIAEKLLQNQREKADGSPATGFGARGKYKNTPTDRNGSDGRKIRFDSRKEARRCDELMLMLRADKIRDLRLQPEFTLVEAYTTPDGKRVRAERYRADFSYYVPDSGGWSPNRDGWTLVVEDVKSKATRTAIYLSKKKRVMEKYGIEIQEV